MSLVATIDNGLNSLALVMGRWTDQFNPILMKEVRQSLKSRQFLGTFLLMLLIAWIISLAVAVVNQEQSMSGNELLIGYLGVLSFCCAVVVPFTTYSSLSSERQQNTYELMQITLLKPSQIVWGKLWTALVQIGVYFSAITPFLGFTLLLEGVDVLILLMALLQIFLFSLLLSMIGICQSSFNTKGVWRSLQTIGWLLFLLWTYFGIFIGGVALNFMLFFFGVGHLGRGGLGAPTNLFEWIGLSLIFCAALIVYGLVMNLLRAAAVCQLTFPSDNRSTPIRRAVFPVILLWPVLSLGIDSLYSLEPWIFFYVILIGLGGYYFVTEVDQMSHRVLRDCQQRAISSWALLIGLLAGAGLQFGLMQLSSWSSSAGYGSGPNDDQTFAISGVAAWLVFTLFSYLLPSKRVVAIPYPMMPSGAAGFALSMIATSVIPPILILHSNFLPPSDSYYLFEQLICVIIYLLLFLSTSYLIARQIHYYLPNESPMVARFIPPLFFAIVLIIATVVLEEYRHHDMSGNILIAAVPFYLVERIRTTGISDHTFLPFAVLILVTSATMICASYLMVIHWLNYQVSKARVQGGTSATLTPTGVTIHAS